jgi:hypothetical protein
MPWAASGTHLAQLWATQQFLDTNESIPATAPVQREPELRPAEARFEAATAVPEREAPGPDPATSSGTNRSSVAHWSPRAVPVAPVDTDTSVDHLEVARP